MKEIYKPLTNFEQFYEVSNKGNIRVKNKQLGGKKEGSILKPKKMRDGYLSFRVNKEKKQILINAHRAVAILFIENPLNKKEVNHKDGNKQNNCVDNLEWCTPKENIAHAIKNGLVIFRSLKSQEYASCHPEKKAVGKDNLCKSCYMRQYKKNKAIKK